MLALSSIRSEEEQVWGKLKDIEYAQITVDGVDALTEAAKQPLVQAEVCKEHLVK